LADEVMNLLTLYHKQYVIVLRIVYVQEPLKTNIIFYSLI
jgi:hypothetical protein